MIIMLTALLLLLHPTSPPHETPGADRPTGSEATTSLAPLSLNGLPEGSTERSPSPTYDIHVALGPGTPTHPQQQTATRTYSQHQGIPIFPNTKTEYTTDAATPTRAPAHAHAHARTRRGHVLVRREKASQKGPWFCFRRRGPPGSPEPGARPNRGGGGGCARALAVYKPPPPKKEEKGLTKGGLRDVLYQAIL
jgi:hypothetical protein